MAHYIHCTHRDTFDHNYGVVVITDIFGEVHNIKVPSKSIKRYEDEFCYFRHIDGIKEQQNHYEVPIKDSNGDFHILKLSKTRIFWKNY